MTVQRKEYLTQSRKDRSQGDFKEKKSPHWLSGRNRHLAGQSGEGHSTKGKSKCKVGEICTGLAAKIKDLNLREGADSMLGCKKDGQERCKSLHVFRP